MTPVSPNVTSSAGGAAPVATTGASAAPAGANTVSTNTTISSMEALKKKSPKVYNLMMQSLAQNINNQSQQHEATLEQMEKEEEQDAEQG